jgi:FkbM family methyltransferase
MIKKILKYFISDYISYRIRALKKTWFPSEKEKKRLKQDEENVKKRKFFYGSFIEKDDLCFDVGANVGNRIIPLIEIGAKIIAVEPQELCCKILKYKFGKRIRIIKKGIGAKESIEDFYLSDATVMSSFSIDWINAVKADRFKANTWTKIAKVEMTSLDMLIEKYGLPKFIKIDVEGYELNVLKGLTKPIDFISFEYTVPEQTNNAIKCLVQIENNDKNIECNYSIGESMEFVLSEWLSVEKMKECIVSKEFIESGFGDIYVRRQK